MWACSPFSPEGAVAKLWRIRVLVAGSPASGPPAHLDCGLSGLVVCYTDGGRSSPLVSTGQTARLPANGESPVRDRLHCVRPNNQTRRSTIIFLISPMALAGFKPFGQVWAQFMIVWQR